MSLKISATFGMLFLMLLFSSICVFAQQMRDPTRPPMQSIGVDKYGLKVNSILYSPKRKFAVVNGKNVSVGDIVSSFKVMKIEKDKVIFQGSEGEFSVSLYADIRNIQAKEKQP